MASKPLNLINVLVAADSPRDLAELRDAFEKCGTSRIVDVRTSDEAMTHFRRTAFDLIVTDSALRPLDGLGLVRLMRATKNGKAGTTPVILVTGKPSPDLLRAGKSLGVSQFLVKPIDADGLKARAERAMDKPVKLMVRGDYYVPVDDSPPPISPPRPAAKPAAKPAPTAAPAAAAPAATPAPPPPPPSEPEDDGEVWGI